ncbi:MAG: rhodanese-like domain-containing protein [Pseudomonadota bacterium]
MGLFDFLKRAPKQTKHRVTALSVHNAHEAAQSGARILIDVRKPEEWADGGRPEGAVGLALQDPDFERKLAQITGADTDKAIAFSCRTGGRSSQAADRALAAGYTDVANVEGGFLAWQAADLPVDYGPYTS